MVGHPFATDVLIADLGLLEKQLLAGRVAINVDDLVQLLRQTRHSDPDLFFTTLAARIDVYKHSFFPKQCVIGMP